MVLLVLPKPSRYDKINDRILAGPAEDLVRECLPDFKPIYASEFSHNMLREFSHVVLTGQESLDKFQPGLTLDNHRGYVWNNRVVATYWPQECVDLGDYESNTDDDDGPDASSTGKDSSSTSRNNYRFWFMRDCEKLFNPPGPISHTFTQISGTQAAALLREVQNDTIYFDLESHPDNYITCFSFAFKSGPVYTVPVYYNRGLCAGGLSAMAGLTRAFSRNKIVIHNAGFDLPFLFLFHGIPFGPDIEDTMLMNHRIWPEAEKSLAHVISLYLNEPYHKDSGGTWNPKTPAQLHNLLVYNAKDVAALRAVHIAQWEYVRRSGDPGLRDSVMQVNASIYPYLWAGLHGFPVNGLRLSQHLSRRKKTQEVWARAVSIAAGYNLNPGSSQQLADYFINRHHYDCLARTESGAPKVDEGALYKYMLKYRNPIIPLILKYKRAQKVASELGFNLYTKPLNYNGPC